MLNIKYPKGIVIKKDKETGRSAKSGNNNKYVFKIVAENKFYIARTSNFNFFDEEIRKTHRRYSVGNGIPETNQYYNLIKYMVSKGCEKLEVELLFTDESGYKVLKNEIEQLSIHYGKSNCANMNNVPNVPKFKTGENSNKWLTRNEYLNFMKLLKKYDH